MRLISLSGGLALWPSGALYLPPKGPLFVRMCSSTPSEMTVPQLKAALKARGLKVGGVKKELLARLEAAASSGAAATAAPRAAVKRAPPPPPLAAGGGGTGPALLVVESPAKCKTISKIVGKGYDVLACNGHVRVLPSRKGAVQPERGFAMDFEVNPRSERTLAALRKSAARARAVYLATDPDREGEAIAAHVGELLQPHVPQGTQLRRISFGEVTARAVTEALAAPREIDAQLVAAQKARQAVDYLVGFTMSPMLWKKLPGCKSAGRVQSVALRLIVEREEELRAFNPQEWWDVDLALGAANAKAVAAALTHLRPADGGDGGGKGPPKLQQFDLASAAAADEAAARLRGWPSWRVATVKTTSRKRTPPPPYNTASLQKDASSRLGMGVSNVMRIAQRLYEGVSVGGTQVALITYMRTDGVHLSQDAVADARSYVESAFGGGAAWLPDQPRTFQQRKRANAQEAHEAVRPVSFKMAPKDVERALEKDEAAVYKLIWSRALASQMAEAVYETLAATLEPADAPKDAQARASVTTLVQKGFRAVYVDADADDDDGGAGGAVGSLAVGDLLPLRSVDPEQHFTKPPPRYNEGSLVSKMEELGVGRPSTYASVMRTLQEREYVRKEAKALAPEVRGQLVTSLLTQRLEKYVQVEFTAALEEDLDKISRGDLDHLAFLERWWAAYHKEIGALDGDDHQEVREAVAESLAHIIFAPPNTTAAAADGGGDGEGATTTAAAGEAEAAAAVAAARKCGRCGEGTLQLKFSSYGPFLGCSCYPDCGFTRQILPDTMNALAAADDARKQLKVLGSDPQSGHEVSLRKGPYGHYLQLGGSAELDSQSDAPALPDTKKLKVAELKAELENRKLPSDGKKAELIARLHAAPDLARRMPQRRASVPPGVALADLTLPMALRLLSLPLPMGSHPDGSGEITLKNGRFGPYLELVRAANGEPAPPVVSVSLPKAVSIFDVELPQAAELLDRKRERDIARGKAKA